MTAAELDRLAEIALAEHLSKMQSVVPGYVPTGEYLTVTRRLFREAAPMWVRAMEKMRRGTKAWRVLE
jgi:hypothetical protein